MTSMSDNTHPVASRRHLFWRSTKSLLESKPWWRAEQWFLSSEILFGFLAAWGYRQGLDVSHIAAGVALCYLIETFCLIGIYRFGRIAGIVTGIFAYLGLALSLWSPFWGLAVAMGFLTPFKDLQGISAIAWMPIKARRRRGTNMDAMIADTILSSSFLMIAMVLSGFIIGLWRDFPVLVACFTAFVLMPRQIMTLPKSHRTLHESDFTAPENVRWLLLLSFLFNSGAFLGRRVLLPIVTVVAAGNLGLEKQAMLILGTVLGTMGLVGIFLRARPTGDPLISGLRFSCIGWILVGCGVLLQHQGHVLALLPLLGGWALLEVCNKTWSIGFRHTLEQSSGKSRPHRKALQQFIIMKSVGGALGCGMAFFLPVMGSPIIVMIFAAISLFVIGKKPSS